MLVSELIQHVTLLADEEGFPAADILQFLNDAIAQINVEAGAIYPPMTLTNDVEHPIPDTWQRLLFVPYAAARVKQNDSSQFEYTDLYNQFWDNLRKFVSKYKVPPEYIDPASKIGGAAFDVTGSPWAW